MVQFIDVDPDEIDNTREAHRGRVSYPILKSFLETGKYVVMLDRTGMQQSLQAVHSSLGSYVRNHTLPIKIFIRRGQLYLMRLDIDKEGNQIPDWKDKLLGALASQTPLPITPLVVESRFKEEVTKGTK